MGLDEFIDDYEGQSEPDDNENEEQENSPIDEYKYNGDEELLDISVDDVKEVINQSQHNFKEKSILVNGKTFCIESKNNSFMMYVATSWMHKDSDCISVSVIDTDSMYDVIDPRLIFPTEGWEDRLLEAITDVLNSRDEIEYCDNCGNLMIYRRTNTGDVKIHGCSNYPDCTYKEIVGNSKSSTI